MHLLNITLHDHRNTLDHDSSRLRFASSRELASWREEKRREREEERKIEKTRVAEVKSQGGRKSRFRPFIDRHRQIFPDRKEVHNGG